MKCTAPRSPKCDNEATDELISLTGSHLGYNCTTCITPLLKLIQGKIDYKSKPLTIEEVEKV